MEVQELGLLSSTTEGLGSIPGWGNKIPQAAQHGQKRKKENLLKAGHIKAYIHVCGCTVIIV